VTFLPFPKNFLIATTSAMMPIMMNFFAAKRATHRPLKNPSFGRDASGYQRRDAISGERQKVGGRAA